MLPAWALDQLAFGDGTADDFLVPLISAREQWVIGRSRGLPVDAWVHQERAARQQRQNHNDRRLYPRAFASLVWGSGLTLQASGLALGLGGWLAGHKARQRSQMIVAELRSA